MCEICIPVGHTTDKYEKLIEDPLKIFIYMHTEYPSIKYTVAGNKVTLQELKDYLADRKSKPHWKISLIFAESEDITAELDKDGTCLKIMTKPSSNMTQTELEDMFKVFKNFYH